MHPQSVGFFLDLDLHVSASSSYADVRRTILQHFDADPRHRVQLYKLEPLSDKEAVGSSEALVVRIPGTNLTGKTVEEIVTRNNSNENTIFHLERQNRILENKLAQSESIRRDALDTVDQLRREFISLVAEFSPGLQQGSRTKREYQRETTSSARRSFREKVNSNPRRTQFKP
jgi:hypothetical protein